MKIQSAPKPLTTGQQAIRLQEACTTSGAPCRTFDADRLEANVARITEPKTDALLARADALRQQEQGHTKRANFWGGATLGLAGLATVTTVFMLAITGAALAIVIPAAAGAFACHIAYTNAEAAATEAKRQRTALLASYVK